MYVHIYTCICMYTPMYICVYICMHIHTYVYIYLCTYLVCYSFAIRACINVYTYIYVYICVYMCIYVYTCTAYPTWSDIFECCFKAQSSKLERLFSLKCGRRDVRALSFELSKMSPQVGLAVYICVFT